MPGKSSKCLNSNLSTHKSWRSESRLEDTGTRDDTDQLDNDGKEGGDSFSFSFGGFSKSTKARSLSSLFKVDFVYFIYLSKAVINPPSEARARGVIPNHPGVGSAIK